LNILPDYREKQSILHIDKKSDKDLTAYGDRYLEAGRIADAVEFYQMAHNHQCLEKIRNIAAEEGDIMLFQSVLRALKENAPDEDWNRIGQNALEKKKYVFAIHAFQKSSNADKAEEVRKMIAAEDQIKTL
jgi:hypothetical protein